MSRLVDSRVRSRSLVYSSIPLYRAPSSQSDAKSFHTTISEDRTDQKALEAHRLVALHKGPALAGSVFALGGSSGEESAPDTQSAIEEASANRTARERASIAKFNQFLF